MLRAVEELNTTFEDGLKSANASPREFEALHRAFNRFATDLEKRLTALERQQAELRQLLEAG
ncbi:MAG: hypothetical protein CSA68_12565 [Rhodobacterales bacterium]|nr:MAG: hypothetical protein CSA68_12565 [Rhodobacterales bacterium]